MRQAAAKQSAEKAQPAIPVAPLIWRLGGTGRHRLEVQSQLIVEDNFRFHSFSFLSLWALIDRSVVV